MRALIRKIRKLLKDKRFRKIWYRGVSSVAAIVVFITTYALVLPAITMESEASCGIPAHQHSSECYEERLICGKEESDGHHHTDDCYTTTRELTCELPEHEHDKSCYDEEGNLTCKLSEHAHEDGCYEEHKELTCTLQESDGHHHDSSCYEQVLTCNLEAHIHSTECYKEESLAVAASTSATASTAATTHTGEEIFNDSTDEVNDASLSDSDRAASEKTELSGTASDQNAEPEKSLDTSAPAGTDIITGSDNNAEEKNTEDTNTENGEKADPADNAEITDAATAATTGVLPEPVEQEELSDGYVPTLDPINMEQVLDRHTGFYYYHADETTDSIDGKAPETLESSADITAWKKVNDDTKLAPTDLIKAYFAYTIPAGRLNETNQVARYRLPSNIHLTDDQIIAINQVVNGVAAAYVDQDTLQVTDADNYNKYLGAEAVEGSRTPDETLVEGTQEYISAVVKAENVFENTLDKDGNYIDANGNITDGPGEYLGQDLIFVFTPYSIEKNQITYDKDGNPTAAGEKIAGWFACDFNTDQIDWVEEETDADLDNTTVEKTADIHFAARDDSLDIEEITQTLKMTEQLAAPEEAAGEEANATRETSDAETTASETTAEKAETSSTKASAETSEESGTETVETADSASTSETEPQYKDGTLTASGDDYTITLDYTADACIPENAELQVREITAETDPEAYEACLEQARASVSNTDSDDKKTVDETASRFFDIEIMAPASDTDGENGEKQKIEPKASVNVNIQLAESTEIAENKSEKDVQKEAETAPTEPTVLHFAEDGVETLESTINSSIAGEQDKPESDKVGAGRDQDNEETGNPENAGGTEIQFEASSFSIYGVVYTVDFSFEVDGKLYEFSMEGGRAVSFAKLAEVLHIAEKYETDNHSADVIKEEDTDEIDADQKDLLGSTDTEEVSREDIVVSDTTKEFLEQVDKIEFSNPDLVLVEKIEKKTTTGEILTKYNVVPEYPYGITDREYCDNYMREFEPIDWVLISLKAFDTPEALTVTMKNGNSYVIEVTDAADAVMVNDSQYGNIAQTITNPSGTTIDLFDYWITDGLRESVGMNGWPGYNGSGYSFQDYNYDGNRLSSNDPPMSQDNTRKESTWYVQNNHLRGNGNNQGINTGHVFKFYPGAAGTVVDRGNKGSHTEWTNNHDEYSSINSWTGNADPTSGLIQKSLNNEGYPQLTNDSAKGTDGSSLSYLFNDDSHAGKQKYGGVDNLLYVDSDGYYTYDSRFYSAEYVENENRFVLKEHSTNASQAQKGFWPFGERVNWHGMHMSTQFSMPANGQVLNPKGEYKDMQFEFSGDDDTWLYVDGVLVGDGGGIHNRTEIDINFATGKVTVTGKKDPAHPGSTETVKTLYDIFKSVKGENNLNPNDWKDVDGDGKPDTFADGSYHKFEMFYLERGGSESNLYIHYNLISTTDFTAHKSYHNTDRLIRDEFKFELIGFDNTTEAGNFKYAIMPGPVVDDGTKLTGWENGAGTVASPKKEHKDTAPGGLAAHTSLIVGVTEDGNVNFGNVQVDHTQVGKSYKYMVREIVPDDAVNMDGVRWGAATDEQKQEGGFVKDGITYDGKIYYFIGTVQESPSGSGNYKVVKTRYTDDTYTVVDTNTKFSNFVNGLVEPLNLKVVKKSDSGRFLSGASFTLTHAQKDDSNDGGSTAEKWIPRQNAMVRTATTQDGALTFEGLSEGHYILEETVAPAGYEKGNASKWLLTLTKVDSESKIILVPTIVPLDENGSIPAGAVPQEFSPDEDFTITHEVINHKKPRSDLSVEKKWLKPDGVTEYTSEELAELNVTGTVIRGELWRKANTQTPVNHPTVTIYGKNQNTSGKGIFLWSGKVKSGSDLSFSVAINATSLPEYTTSIPGKSVNYTSNTGTVTYTPRPGNPAFSKNGNANLASLNNITEDIEIYADFSAKPTDNNIGYSIISRTVPSSSTAPQQLDEKVDDFTLSGSNNWKTTWHSADLHEEDYDYEYYLKNVSEPSLEGFTFIKNPAVSTDGTTGVVTYTVKNIKEGPKTDLTVRKVWADDIDHSTDTVKYKILRAEYDRSGNLKSGPYEYIAEGDTAAREYTLPQRDVYDGESWQRHHTDLPADNGKEVTAPDYRTYQYSVEETSTHTNYAASYADVDGVKVIINTPTDKRVTVEKKWVDADGKPITEDIPQGAYITGTLKRRYTYQDPAGATVKIYYQRMDNGAPTEPELRQTFYNVAIQSKFSLWALESTQGGRPNNVKANNIVMAQDGDLRSFRLYDRTENQNGYTTTINGDTNIIVDWYYNNMGNPAYSTVFHDEDYTISTGGGTEHTETETVGSFRLDAANNWTWSWMDRNLNETEGRTYTYFIENVAEHTADGTAVDNYEGFKEPVISSMTKGSDQRWYASITNEQTGTKTSLRIKKVEQGTSTPLSGAKFTLTKVDESGHPITGDDAYASGLQEVDANGELTIGGLKPGRYLLEEKVAPANHKITEGMYYIDVKEGGTSELFTGGVSDRYKLITQESDGSYTIKNEKTSGSEPDLPDSDVEYHKRIDALRDGVPNPDSTHASTEDLTDLYRLYLDYKVKSVQEAEGVDLLFVIDHSGSMNSNESGGNEHRAPNVMKVLNGDSNDGLIASFMHMNEHNRWAAVGFYGPPAQAGWAGSIPVLNYAGTVFEESWAPMPYLDNTDAGQRDSEVLSPDGENYTWQNSASTIDLGPQDVACPETVLTNYTAGLWRAEQFLKKDTDRKKVIIFISDGLPTLYINCDGTLEGAGTEYGSRYYRHNNGRGGCAYETLQQFNNFVNDVTNTDGEMGYTFGENIEIFTVGFGDSFEAGSYGHNLLNNMVEAAYGSNPKGHFTEVTDTSGFTGLSQALSAIVGTTDTYTNLVIQDDLNEYVDLCGIADDGIAPANILQLARTKVTMTPDPSDPSKLVVLYYNGVVTSAGTDILESVGYDPETKKVTATFKEEYEAQPGYTYTLSFDVKATEAAYTEYEANGYSGTSGAADTDFIDPFTKTANKTSSGKGGLHSNDDATVTYKHKGEDNSKTYPHPVIQVFNAPLDLLKVDQVGHPLAGAKFKLYKDAYDPSGTADAETNNSKNLVGSEMTSTITGTAPDQVARISLQKLKPGKYYLVETDPPKGYKSLGVIEIEVKVTTLINQGTGKDTVDTVTVTAKQDGNPIGNDKLIPGDGEWTLKVMNTAGVELPSTGGPGTRLFYLLGGVLTALALVLLKVRRPAA